MASSEWLANREYGKTEPFARKPARNGRSLCYRVFCFFVCKALESALSSATTEDEKSPNARSFARGRERFFKSS
jgi:hypothetical protein